MILIFKLALCHRRAPDMSTLLSVVDIYESMSDHSRMG